MNWNKEIWLVGVIEDWWLKREKKKFDEVGRVIVRRSGWSGRELDWLSEFEYEKFERIMDSVNWGE